MMLDKTPIFDQLVREYFERKAMEDREAIHNDYSAFNMLTSKSPTQVEVTNGRVTA